MRRLVKYATNKSISSQLVPITMTKIILAILSITIFTSFQVTIDKTLLLGKWKLTSNAYISAKKMKYCDCKTYSPVTKILANGTYIQTLNGKTIQTGSWKLQSIDILCFYNNKDVPDIPNVFIDDGDHKILSLTKDKLVLKETICSEEAVGESTYSIVK